MDARLGTLASFNHGKTKSDSALLWFGICKFANLGTGSRKRVSRDCS